MTLAAQAGQTEIFNHILMKWRRVFYIYGPVQKYLLDIEGLDEPYHHHQHPSSSSSLSSPRISPLPTAVVDSSPSPPTQPQGGGDGNIKQTGSEYLMRRSSSIQLVCRYRHYDMIMLASIQDYLNKKWRHWGRHLLLRRFAFTAANFILCASALVIRKDANGHFPWDHQPSVTGYFSCGLTLAVLLFTAIDMIPELRTMYRFGGRHYLHVHSGAARVYSGLVLVFSTGLFAGVGADFLDGKLVRSVCLSLAMLTLSFRLAWYLLGFRRTGPLIMIILEVSRQTSMDVALLRLCKAVHR